MYIILVSVWPQDYINYIFIPPSYTHTHTHTHTHTQAHIQCIVTIHILKTSDCKDYQCSYVVLRLLISLSANVLSGSNTHSS